LRVVAVFVVTTIASSVFASGIDSNTEMWTRSHPVIVVGKIAMTGAVEDRELGADRAVGCLFPFGAAEIEVLEVVKNTSELHVAVGDTIRLFYPTSRDGYREADPGIVVGSGGYRDRDFHAGQLGIFAPTWLCSEWRAEGFRVVRDIEELAEVKAALAP
jgi:hypothetical protein